MKMFNSVAHCKLNKGAEISPTFFSSASLFLVVSFCQAHILEIRWLFLD